MCYLTFLGYVIKPAWRRHFGLPPFAKTRRNGAPTVLVMPARSKARAPAFWRFRKYRVFRKGRDQKLTERPTQRMQSGCVESHPLAEDAKGWCTPRGVNAGLGSLRRAVGLYWCITRGYCGGLWWLGRNDLCSPARRPHRAILFSCFSAASKSNDRKNHQHYDLTCKPIRGPPATVCASQCRLYQDSEKDHDDKTENLIQFRNREWIRTPRIQKRSCFRVN